MRITPNNSRYDEESGAVIFHQSEETQLLTEILQTVQTLSKKVDVLLGEAQWQNSGKTTIAQEQ